MKNAMADADTTTTAEPMSPRPSLRKNAVARLITGAITLAISQASGIIIARAMGADGKGLASLLFLATLIAVMAVDLGLTMSAVYFVGRRKHPIQVVVNTYLTVGLIGGVFVALVFIVLRNTLFGGHYPNLVIILAISLPATILYGWFSGVLRGQEKILEVSWVNIAGAVVGILILSLSVFILQQEEMSIVWSSAASAVFGLVSVALLLHRQGLRFKFHLDTALLRDCIGYGLKGQIGQILQFINYRFDLLVVNVLLGMSAVGIYSVGASVSTLIWQIPNALSYALYSRVSSVDH